MENLFKEKMYLPENKHFDSQVLTPIKRLEKKNSIVTIFQE
jgi:hypothetical protein